MECCDLHSNSTQTKLGQQILLGTGISFNTVGLLEDHFRWLTHEADLRENNWQCAELSPK